MICVLNIGFELTTNFMWTYRVTHLEWIGNQALGLKFVFKPKGSPRGSFIHLWETAMILVSKLAN